MQLNGNVDITTGTVCTVVLTVLRAHRVCVRWNSILINNYFIIELIMLPYEFNNDSELMSVKSYSAVMMTWKASQLCMVKNIDPLGANEMPYKILEINNIHSKILNFLGI